jgi:uncharacterized phage protein (TIGR02218 family)
MKKELTTWYIAELYTFWLNYGLSYNAGTFNSGKILLYTGHDTDLQIGGNIYQHWSIEHGDIEEKRGVETSSTTLTINYNPFDVIQGLDVTWYQALQSGVFDGCYLSIDRLYSPIPWSYQMANISSDYVLKNRFFGLLDVGTDSGMKMTSCQMKLESPTSLLNMQIPRNLVKPSCLNRFCDSMCTLIKSDYAYTVTAQSGSSKTAIISNVSEIDGFFSQGTMLGLTGENTGVSRTIKTYASNTATPGEPWKLSVSTGDTFTFYRGCSKTISVCEAYSNLTHFRGFPWLPVQNTLL